MLLIGRCEKLYAPTKLIVSVSFNLLMLAVVEILRLAMFSKVCDLAKR